MYKFIAKHYHIFILTIIVIIAFLLRYLSWRMDPTVARDAVLYVEMAESWFKHGDYNSMIMDFPNWEVIPFLMLWLMKLVMTTGVSGETAGIIFNITLGSLLPLIIYAIAGLFFKKKELPLGAALIAAFHPELIELSTEVLRDTPYLFLIGMALWSLLSAIKYQKWWQWFLGGTMLTLAAFTRYESLELLLLVLGYLLVAPLLRWVTWRKIGISWLCFLSSSILTLFLIHIAAGVFPENSILHYRNYINRIYHKTQNNTLEQ